MTATCKTCRWWDKTTSCPDSPLLGVCTWITQSMAIGLDEPDDICIYADSGAASLYTGPEHYCKGHEPRETRVIADG